MKKILLVSLLTLLSFVTTGCATRAIVGSNDGYHQGPPPHAPAHGYRHKHKHHDLEYDSKLGVYAVLGYDDHFFIDNLYFRYRDGDWEVSSHLSDGWRHADRYQVPRKLRHSKGGKDKGYSKKDKDREHKGHGKKKWEDD